MEKRLQHAITALLAGCICILSSCGCDLTTGLTVRNPSGHYVAFTEGGECGGALSSYESHVQISRPYNLFGYQLWTSRKGIFGATVNLDQLTIHWTDEHNLSVACRCRKDAVLFNDAKWRDISITYAFTP